MIERYKGLREGLNRRTIKLFAGSRLSASLYYFLFSRQFGREHQAVLQGRLKYYRSLQTIGRSSALLRRNTHRIEKGLIMRPRRPVFGEAYILETLECYAKAVRAEDLCIDEKKWATDVIAEYFNVVQDTPVIAKARKIFEQRRWHGAEAPSRSIPKARASYPDLSVNTDALEALFVRRRSVRWFLPEAVPQAKLNKAINLASLAPSACNRQPY